LAIHLLDIYRSSNIGIFLRCNEKFLLVPRGLAKTKTAKLCKFLEAEPVEISIGGSRLIGPLVAMNGNGVLVSRFAEDEEIRVLKAATGLRVERLPSKYTSIGNLIAANNQGAIVSRLLRGCENIIADVFGTPVEFLTVATYDLVGSTSVVTNDGAAVHPYATAEEIAKISEVLKVNTEPATINGGVPFVSSGIVTTKKLAVVGSLTSGPELVMLSHIFKL
jgi:translation initiation factor 6